MAGGVGNLTVGLGLDAAEFTRGLTKAEVQARTSSRRIAESAGGVFAGLNLTRAVDEAVAAISRLTFGQLAAIDAFNDLKDASGASVENISALDRIARETGTSFSTVETSVLKLNQSLNAAKPDSNVARALQAIGLSAEELKKLDPAIALQKVAQALAGYAEDGNKARAVQLLFNKSIKEVGPFLVDLAKKGELVAGTTTDQAQAVEDYRKGVFKLRADIEDLGRSLTVSLIPQLLETTAKIKDLFNIGPRSSSQLSKDIAALTDIAAGQRAQLEKGDSLLDVVLYGTKEKRADNLAATEKDIAKARALYQAAVGTSTAGAGRGSGYGDFRASASVPDKPDKKRAGPKDDPTNRLLDNQLRAFEANIAAERELLQTRNKFLDLANAENLLSIKQYYDARTAYQVEATKVEVANYEGEISAIRAVQREAGRSLRDRAADEGKINELIAKRDRAESQLAEDTAVNARQAARAQEGLARAFEDVNLQVLELGSNLVAAATVRFDAQFDVLRKTFTAEGNAAGLEAIDTLRAAAIAQAAFQKAAIESSRTLDALAVQEERVGLALQIGSTTSLEALVKVGELRRAQIPVLEAQVAAEEAIARASGNPALIQNAEAARLALDRLKASSDPLAESLNKSFGDGFNSALDDFVTGTRSAGDAFKSFSKSVLNDILKMGSKSITESIFGGSGGAGGFLSSLFSSGSGAGASSGGFASLLSAFSGYFAKGGTIAPGKWGIAGENGPEPVFGGATGKTVMPASSLGGTVQNFNVNVTASEGMTRGTALQRGREIGEGIRQATSRNG